MPLSATVFTDNVCRMAVMLYMFIFLVVAVSSCYWHVCLQ